MIKALSDRYGFWFWLKWILWFAGSFVLTALFWTALMRKLFGAIYGPELTITWVVSVFGCWLILVIPCMRKKEQIWKRLNSDQEKAVDAWLSGMGIFVGLLVASLFSWGFFYREKILADPNHMDTAWFKAVIGSWLVILLPFLVLMYRRADTIFKTAVERQTYEPKFRSISVELSKRILPEEASRKLREIPPTLRQGHLVNFRLKNGQKVSNVFILNSKEIVGLYDQSGFNFSPDDILDIESIASEDLPAFEESKWLRLDSKT